MELDALVAAALVGDRTPASSDEAMLWLDHAARHRVETLLAARWMSATAGPLRSMRDQLAGIVRAAAVVDGMRDVECRRVYRALAQANVRAAVLKGAALAHTVYRHSYLRPRCDTDILVDRRDEAMVSRTLAQLGYTADVETTGALVSAQRHFSRVDERGTRHAWDVHWRVSNAHAAAGLLSLDRIIDTGHRVAAVEGLVVPCPTDALLLACVHRVVHHHDSPDLLWLFDIHLLAESLSAMDWSAFEAFAADRAVWPICARSLARAHERFGTRLPQPIAIATVAAASTTLDGFEAEWREIDVLRMNLRALKTWRERIRLVREHLFPPAAFIADRYQIGHRAALPWAYLHRIVTGAPKWFRRHGAA